MAQTVKNLPTMWETQVRFLGQEKYRSLTKIFYKDAAVAILVYDITDEDSFQKVSCLLMGE